MIRGGKSFKSIQKWYHQVDKVNEYILFEHNLDDEEAFIIVDTIRNCYTYTFESILYTLDKPDGYTWFRFAVIH